MIRDAKVPFHELELEQLLKKALKSRRLAVFFGREATVLRSDMSFIAVGTPSLPDGSANLASALAR